MKNFHITYKAQIIKTMVIDVVMKKWFFMSIFFINSQLYAYCQNETVKIEGFLIERYYRNEILSNNKLPIDHSMNTFYFTTQIDSIHIMSLEEIYSALNTSYYKNNEVYKFFPFDKEYYNYIDPNIHPVPLENQNIFYTLCSDSTYFYKVYFIKGQAIRLCIANDYLNSKKNMELAVKWNISPSTIDKRIPFFYVYVFFDIMNDSTDSNIPTFFKPIVESNSEIQENP